MDYYLLIWGLLIGDHEIKFSGRNVQMLIRLGWIPKVELRYVVAAEDLTSGVGNSSPFATSVGSSKKVRICSEERGISDIIFCFNRR